MKYAWDDSQMLYFSIKKMYIINPCLLFLSLSLSFQTLPEYKHLA